MGDFQPWYSALPGGGGGGDVICRTMPGGGGEGGGGGGDVICRTMPGGGGEGSGGGGGCAWLGAAHVPLLKSPYELACPLVMATAVPLVQAVGQPGTDVEEMPSA